MIEIPLEGGIMSFLAFRHKYMEEVFTIPIDSKKVKLMMPYNNGSWLTCEVNTQNPIYQQILYSINEPLFETRFRLYTHDYGDASSWPAPDNSIFTFAPNELRRLRIEKFIARFPRRAHFGAGNYAYFKTYMSLDGASPVIPGVTPPVSVLTFEDTEDLLIESETPITVTSQVVSGAFQDSMSDIVFTSPWMPLRYHLGEHIDVGLVLNNPITNELGEDLIDPCRFLAIGTEIMTF